MVKLTICIPTYNRAVFLRDALESVQDNIEQLSDKVGLVDVVVSDNCSSDSTARVVNEFRATIPITYKVNEENVGADENIRRCASLARGEYIWLLSDDDAMTDYAISHLFALLSAFPDVAYVFCPRLLADRNLDVLERDPQPRGLAADLVFEDGQSLFAALDGQMPPILFYVSSTIIRKSIWDKAARDIPAKIAGWGHAEVILPAIIGERCAIMGKPGVACRLENHRETRSMVWFDNYISVFLLAKQLGYSTGLCDFTIQGIINFAQKGFVLDRIRGKRSDSIPVCLSRLGITNLVRRRSVWMWLSCLPVGILRFGLPLYNLQRTLKMRQ